MIKGGSASKGAITTTYGADYGRPGSTKSRTNNPLLIKYPVGKPKPVSYALPDEEHVYGRPIDRRPDETTAKVLSSWQTKQKTKNAVPSLDYVTMNKMCVQEGIVDARGQYEHRKSHPIRVKLIDHSDGRRTSARKLPSDANPHFAYGLPTRPSSPVSKLMSDHYEREYAAQVAAKEAEHNNKSRSKRGKVKSVKEQMVPLQKPKPKHLTIFERDVQGLFKMPRFRGVEPRVDSWQELPLRRDGQHVETSS
ncbi:hypothetical protein BCR44DRAFT_52345 [Catenaria anguillulae PL171]|uniref:Uncharacterized protein n=1 Tax=Catenaria anguillulae PL171 TaxID=765915 RepID=A0A1Y2HLL7_9FUNG|nr:hypothetical protein BCR44DRAFT_52345 [Catenaria anguillulae PL171]